MIRAQPTAQSPYIQLRLFPVIKMTDDQFFELCQINEDLWIERTAEGDLVITTLRDCRTSHRNVQIAAALGTWERQDGNGVAFGCVTGFMLPNTAVWSPDASWVKRSKLATLTAAEKRKFLPLCPDFALELKSPTDSIDALKVKMQEYIDNGAELGWLIDAEGRRVYIYRPNCPVECLENPSTVSGEPVLPGFVLDLKPIWEIDF